MTIIVKGATLKSANEVSLCVCACVEKAKVTTQFTSLLVDHLILIDDRFCVTGLKHKKEFNKKVTQK